MAVSEEDLARAAQLIQEGRLVAFPTETVYGLGANALDKAAVQRLYAVKGRPATNPVIVHVAEAVMAKSLTAEWHPIADVLADVFWPGPLTIVLRKAGIVPDEVTAQTNTVGIRIPAHPVALDLIRRAVRPIAAPSANRFTHLSPTTVDHVKQSLAGSVDMILDGGPCAVGIESTVVSLVGGKPVILRPGMISAEDLEGATGVKWPLLTTVSGRESPGLHRKHYSPKTPFHILRPGEPKPGGIGTVLALPADPDEYAEALYAEMHKADRQGWDWIAVLEPPDGPKWSGIRDRLRRAAAK